MVHDARCLSTVDRPAHRLSSWTHTHVMWSILVDRVNLVSRRAARASTYMYVCEVCFRELFPHFIHSSPRSFAQSVDVEDLRVPPRLPVLPSNNSMTDQNQTA